MSKLSCKNFINLNKQEKELILSWRNSDRIRLKMLNQEIISAKKHFDWIDKLSNRNDCIYFLVYFKDEPIGTISFTEIDTVNKTCTIGCYTGETALSGLGIVLVYLNLYYAFEIIQSARVNALVLFNNQRTYKMHKTIFYAKDEKIIENSDLMNAYSIYWDKHLWYDKKEDLKSLISNTFNINEIELTG